MRDLDAGRLLYILDLDAGRLLYILDLDAGRLVCTPYLDGGRIPFVPGSETEKILDVFVLYKRELGVIVVSDNAQLL